MFKYYQLIHEVGDFAPSDSAHVNPTNSVQTAGDHRGCPIDKQGSRHVLASTNFQQVFDTRSHTIDMVAAPMAVLICSRVWQSTITPQVTYL